MRYVALEHCRITVFPFIYAELSRTEPSAQYEQENNGLADPLFLYNLAIVIGDRTKWGDNVDFTALKQKVSQKYSTAHGHGILKGVII